MVKIPGHGAAPIAQALLSRSRFTAAAVVTRSRSAPAKNR